MNEREPKQFNPVLGRINTQLLEARKKGLDQRLLQNQQVGGVALPDVLQDNPEILDMYEYESDLTDTEEWGVLLPEEAEIQNMYANDILSPDIELKLGHRAKGDAAMLACLLHHEAETEEDREPAANAAYRGIVFAHMLRDEVYDDGETVPLDEYWKMVSGQTPEFVARQIVQDALSYQTSNAEVQSLLECYRPELTRFQGFEEMVDIGACLTLRQADINAAANEAMPEHKKQISNLHDTDASD